MSKEKLYDTEIFNRPEIVKEPPTPSELAEKSGLDRGTVKRVMAGEDTRVSTLRKLAKARGYKLKITFEPMEARQ